MSILWPRLPGLIAEAYYQRCMASSIDQLAAAVEMEAPERTYGATGGAKATHDDLATLRAAILLPAQEFGFPAIAGLDERIAFDRALAPAMIDAMGIVAAEAANRGVWSYVSLVVAPDVTMWRFGGANVERWIATDLTRHVFGRLWWQAYLLVPRAGGVSDTSLLEGLTESDLNQLLERTQLGGARSLVRALARGITEAPSGVPRRELIREATTRMRRRMAFIDHMALTDAQLAQEVKLVIEPSILAIGGASP